MTETLSPQAISTLQSVGYGEMLAMPETASLLISHLTAYAQANPEKGEALHHVVRDQVALSYGIRSSRENEKPFIYQDGIAIIPVHGILLNRFNSSWGFATGYNFLRAQLNAALDDLAEGGGDVEVIAWDVNSPGGESAGNFELCREIMAARERVRMISVVDAMAASGGYSIASAANRMVAIPSARVGSIGVYQLLEDITERLAQMGIKMDLIKAGERKTDGSPYEKLTDEARASFQESVDKTWEEFIALVAEQRDIEPEAVRATQARIYRAQEALDLGLIDAVSTPSEAVSEFMAELASDDPYYAGDEDVALPKNEAEMKILTDAAREEGIKSVEVVDKASVAKEAVTADRKRRSEIMALPAAEKRQKLASTLADRDTPVADAEAILASAAEEQVAAPTETAKVEDDGTKLSTDPKATPGETVSEFTKRMDGTEQPNIAANNIDGKGGDTQMSDDDKAAEMILGDQKRLTGTPLRSDK